MSRFFTRASATKGVSSASPVSGYPFTLACRLRTTDTSTSKGAFCVGGSAQPRRHLLYINGGTVRTYAEMSGVGYQSASAGSLTSGQWHSCGAVFASSTSRTAYLDGTASTTDTNSITFDSANIDSTIVGYDGWDTGNYFAGDIAEAGIWNVALTANDFAALAAGISPLLVRSSALVRYYPLIGKSSPEPDLRNGFGLTLTNSPTASDNPRVFRPHRRIWVPVSAGGGGGDFEHVASGGILLAGAATSALSANFSFASSGGAVFGGSAPASSTANYTATSAGGIAFGGAASATSVVDYTFTASGLLQLGGAATVSSTADYAVTAAGGIAFGGAASASSGSDFESVASGGILFAGAATITHTRDYLVTGSGGVTFGGVASTTLTADYTYSSSGLVTFSGTAVASLSTGGGDCPTVEEIVAGILAGMNSTPPAVNVKQVNDKIIYGNGIPVSDVFRVTP